MSESAGGPSRFREQAVLKLQSPDRLDATVSVTDAKGWIAAGVGIVAVAAAAIWGVFGSIPDRVEGPMVLARPDSVFPLVAPLAGTIFAISAPPGTALEPGDVVLTLVDVNGEKVDIPTPRDGTVEQVFVSPGLPVTPGTELVRILESDLTSPLVGIALASPQDIVKLQEGQRVTVQPSTVDARDAGQLVGEITFVGELPSRGEAIAVDVQNLPLAQLLAAQAGGVPYLVRVEFADPPEWTNGDEPDFRVKDGTLSQFSVVVDHDRPIDLIFHG